MTKLSTMGMTVLMLLLATFSHFFFWWMIELELGQLKKEEHYLLIKYLLI